MKLICVVIETDYDDTEKALTSVAGNLERVGYNVVTNIDLHETETHVFTGDGVIHAKEPEVSGGK